MASGHGGKRAGAGKPKGFKHMSTLTKELAREEARKYIQSHMPRMLSAQVENACGLAHLMIRNEDGTWQKAPDEMTAEQVADVLNGDPNRYYIAMKDPNTQVFNTLAAYAWDKPREPVDVQVHGEVELVERLAKARDRVKR